MKIKFTENRILATGQPVAAGEELEVSATDGAAFIANGVAVAADKTKTKED